MSHEDRIHEIEKEKYIKVWENGDYRKFSPGEQEAKNAMKLFGVPVNNSDSVVDFGCGEGFSVQKFNDAGYKAWGVEHAPNAVKAAGILVYEKCLWDMADLPYADFGFCCDVMEHIPTSKVHLVLSQMRQLCREGVFFRIATRPDTFGHKILGVPLHLTVESPTEWWTRLHRHWEEVETREIYSGSYVTFFARTSRSVESRNTLKEST